MAGKDLYEHSQKTSPSQNSKATSTDHDKVEAATEPSKIVGPSLSYHHDSEGDEHSEASDDSSDDDFGPQLPPVGATASNDAKYERESRYSPPPEQHEIITESATTKKRQRDDWMVTPPDNQSWASGMNPTTISNRRFNTGKSARGDQSSGGIGAAWTENPTQKRQRLENEVLGIKAEPDTRSARPRDLSSKTNTATANKVQPSNKGNKPSLYESHQKAMRNTSEEDPSSRAFSWEKDIAGKSSISSASRKKLVNQASDYSSKFTGGKYI
ncbi:hypothetical protein UA08_07854 [Talaromyces atroroseus]|uniref:DUF3752 domain-containing protein n=1 Tax=Talaromyces atroroseus TaxID=1441469 RepID=A0A225A859_TALAT|nr:hypothetical protein UA08_07854 [Talaromyces atroroseus]OKL56901.1 hypothetical protein UA08_07854 [Talaromyces atroroseus]